MAISLTKADLITYLRMRLNDSLVGSNTSGNYSDTELGFCVDLAYRETCIASKSHKARVSVSLTADTHTYDCTTIFEPVEISHNDIFLEKVELGDMGVNLQSWDSTASGTPIKWMQLTGGFIRLYPTPDAIADNYDAIVQGYAYPADMGTSDEPVAIQDGYAVSVLLDRAEAEARFMRSTYGANAQLGTLRLQNWQQWVEMINKSIKGEG